VFYSIKKNVPIFRNPPTAQSNVKIWSNNWRPIITDPKVCSLMHRRKGKDINDKSSKKWKKDKMKLTF